jgi:ribonucleoside-triphosphate reductase
MSLSKLSQFIAFLKYAKFLPSKGRRETWEETVWRNAEMHLEKFKGKPDICKEIRRVYRDFVVPMKIVPSARSLQYAGEPMFENPARMYNCCFVMMDNLRAFDEAVFLLMSGCGVGFSVEKHVIDKLPAVIVPTGQATYVIEDTKEGWANAFRELIGAYFGLNAKPSFDFSKIRPAGAPLKLSGGTASGPAALKESLRRVELILSTLKSGDRLSSLQIFDIVCLGAKCVAAGGSRRSSLICLFSPDDQELLTCKEYQNLGFDPENPDKEPLNAHRFGSNNSAVFYRDTVTREQFDRFWAYASTQRTGDPGIYWSSAKGTGANPCVEVGLFSGQFCCLVEINGATITSQEDFEQRCWAASFIATLQASYTDFKYLRPLWKEVTESEALIGVGITGICSGPVNKLNLKAGSAVVKATNVAIARAIGINASPRCTVVKPAGTTSLLFGCSSGIHSWHGPRYRRRITLAHIEPVWKFLKATVPEALEPIENRDGYDWLNFPVTAPENSIYRSETLDDLLERILKWNSEWIGGGHRGGAVRNNVSATLPLRNGDWDRLGPWMWENRNRYNGLAFFPDNIAEDPSRTQWPHEDCTEDEILEMTRRLANFDLSKFIEVTDTTDFLAESACTTESCELPLRQKARHSEQISV